MTSSLCVRTANFPYMHYVVFKSPTSRHHVASSDVAKQQQTQQQDLPSRHRHQHHSTTMTTPLSDVSKQFTDVIRSRGTDASVDLLSPALIYILGRPALGCDFHKNAN